jgi:hypothetical protein
MPPTNQATLESKVSNCGGLRVAFFVCFRAFRGSAPRSRVRIVDSKMPVNNAVNQDGF